MTIKVKTDYRYPSPISPPSEDDDNLSLGNVSDSDTDSLQNTPQIPQIPQRKNRIQTVEKIDKVEDKKNPGKRWLRIYQNRCALETLIDGDENENYGVVMESYKGPFTRLLENAAAMRLWNEFIEKPEEQQLEIVRASSNKYHSRTECRDDRILPGRISSKIRHTFKIRKNLSLENIHECEKDLIEFFKARPADVYVKFPPTSFDRLVIHAIAQYHRLQAIDSPVAEGTRRSIEVRNTTDNWSPVDSHLLDFIESLRK